MRDTLRGKEKLFPLGFGAMRLPMKDGLIDKEKSKEYIYYGIDHGVNYIDTAYIYNNGESEKFLGEILQGEYRDKVNISTKCPAFMVNSYEDFDKFLNIQLKRLQTDHIDFYYMHSVNLSMLKKLMDFGLKDFAKNAKKDGRIRNIGFSYHGASEEFKEACDLLDWDSCIILYNYFDENTQAGLNGIKYAYSKNMTVIIMEPLKGGLLAGQMPNEVEELFNKNDENKSAAKWALSWVLNHEEVTCALSGMGKMEEMKENINTAKETIPNSFTNKEIETIKEAQKIMQEKLEINCTGCGYCKPCPFGVDIPECFRIYNQKYLFEDNSKTMGIPHLTMTYYMNVSGLLNVPSYAGKCINCRTCVSKCPQHLSIPRELRKVSKEFEGHAFGIKVGFLKNIGLPIVRLINKHTNRNKS